MKKILTTSTTVMSILLVAFFIVTDTPTESQTASAVETTSLTNKPMIQDLDNITLDFKVPNSVYASQLTPIEISVKDSSSGAPISHVDWAISVKDPDGNIVYKTTTAHSHAGKMNFDVSFPSSGEHIVSLTANSIGPKMMGMDVPPKAYTHTMLSGSLMGFETDPANNFGSRAYEFPINVLNQQQVRTLDGSESGTKINVELSTTSDKIVAGKPATLILTTSDATGKESMMSHVDALVKVRKGSYITSDSASRDSEMMPMNGAYHGHLGQVSFTTTFPSPGNYIINAELNSLGVSSVQFGMADARFNVLVAESSGEIIHDDKKSEPGKVDIVGLEAPFYAPNNISAKVGQKITFDNVDANFHTVTSGSPETGASGDFDSGVMSAGEKFSLAIDKPGTYDYFCTIHTNMVGTITVS